MTKDPAPSGAAPLIDGNRLDRLAAVVDGSGVAVLDTATNGEIVRANPAAHSLFGYAEATLVGLDVARLFPADAWPAVMSAGLRVHRGEAVEAVRTAALGPRGRRIDVTLRMAAVRDADGAVVGVAGFVRDVTVEAAASRALAASERRLRAVYEDAPMPQAILDLDARFVSANAALRRLLGRDDLDGRSVLDLRHPDDPATPDEWMGIGTTYLRGGSAERLATRPDGSPVPLLVLIAPIHDEDGSTAALGLFAQDLTGLRTAEQAVTRAEAVAPTLGSAASDWAIILDAAGRRMTYVSPSARAVLGFDPVAVTGDDAFDYIHPDDRPIAQAAIRGVIDQPGAPTDALIRVRDSRGSWLWTEHVVTNRFDDPAISGLLVNARDVTARVEADLALRRSEARYRTIAETANEGIWSVDPQGRTQYANARMLEILGVTSDRIYAGSAVELLAPDDPTMLLEKLRNRAQIGAEQYELEYLHPDGRTRVLAFSVSPLTTEDGSVGSLGMISDVSDARRVEGELRRRALHDDLTGLANRTLLEDRLEQAISRRERVGSAGVAVLFADLDQFKLVNDSWGHGAGDELLSQVARRISAAVRPGDTVARFGGDEFVIVAEDADEAVARELADRVLQGLATPFDVAGNRAYVNASIGVAVAPPASAEELLRFADSAMYRAKSRGRGQVQVFDPALADESADRLRLGNDLREALAADELELHYQPIIELASGRVLGVEALARWNHPQRGPVSPQRFVAVAESLGLAPALDRWVLARAARDAARLRRSMGPELRVAVNISARHLTEGDLEQAVRDELPRFGADAPGLVLELTESSVMDDPAQARLLLERLAALGVATAVDDFGTGYSSLGYLSRLPVTTLKIDRSFVDDMTRDPDSLAIAASIIDLARSLRLATVAEGVETPEQLALLQGLGCQSGQGYLWSPAVPFEQLEELVAGLPLHRFDVTPGADTGVPSIHREVITTDHGLHRLMALHREGASLTTIAAALNAEGYRTPRGLRWHRSTVARVVSGMAYPNL